MDVYKDSDNVGWIALCFIPDRDQLFVIKVRSIKKRFMWLAHEDAKYLGCSRRRQTCLSSYDGAYVVSLRSCTIK